MLNLHGSHPKPRRQTLTWRYVMLSWRIVVVGIVAGCLVAQANAQCPPNSPTWQGLQVCAERSRDGYFRNEYGRGYRGLEHKIIAALPDTMKADGRVYTPYSCAVYDIEPDGTAATDIEHIVALAEAHDSHIPDDHRKAIAKDLDNLTIAAPHVNQQKGDRDAAEWTPERHGAWYAGQVVAVKQKYGLSVDVAERDALDELLEDDGAGLNCIATGPTLRPIWAMLALLVIAAGMYICLNQRRRKMADIGNWVIIACV